MKKQCAWCKQMVGNVESLTPGDRGITHVICEDCMRDIEFQEGVDLTRFLDTIDIPLFVRDEHDTISNLNQAAANLFSIDRSAFSAKNPGLVFACKYARYPEGCGRTVHCSGCSIRKAIEQTLVTGRGVFRQPATLTQDDVEVSLLVSTEKIGTIVLIRIDELITS